MFSKMTIRLRLGLMMAGIGVLAVIVGVTGLIGMRHANTRVQDGYAVQLAGTVALACLLYTSPSPRDATLSRMPSSA